MPPNNTFDGLKHQSNLPEELSASSVEPSESAADCQGTSSTNLTQDAELADLDSYSPEEPRLSAGRVVYFGLLSLLLVAAIGLPIWVLLEQERQAQIAGVSENKAVTEANGAASQTQETATDDEVYVYDPKTQTFTRKIRTSNAAPVNITQGGGAVNLNPATPMDGANFAEAFAQARRQLGPGAVFEWNGQLYTTDYQTNEAQASQENYPVNIYANLPTNRKLVSDATGKVLEINECNLNVKYPIYTQNGALVDFDREQAAANSAPYWTFYAFTGYRTKTEKFGIGYTLFIQCFNLSSLGEAHSKELLQAGDAVNPSELYHKTGWWIANQGIDNLRISRNQDLVQGYSVTFTRGGQLYSINFMAKPKDANDKIGGLYAYQVQLQFQDQAK